MAALVRCEVWTSYQCDSGTRQAVLPIPDLVEMSGTMRTTGEDTLTLTVPKASSAADALALGRVIRLLYDDASFDEWRIHELRDQSGSQGGLYRISCRTVLYELRDLAVIASTSSGVLTTSVTYDGKTATDVVDALLPYLPGWWSRGTIAPTTAVSFSSSEATPLLVIRDLIKALASAGDPCELQVSRVGTTGYAIDLPTAIGASEPDADVRTARNILTSERTRTRETMANRIYPRCSDGSGIEYAYWKVTAISGSDITIRQAETNAAALAFDDQLNGLYLENDAGTRTLISDSVASTSTVTVASASGFAVDEWCRVCLDSGGAGLLKLDYPLAVSPKVAIIDDGSNGVTNILANPYMSRWPGSTSAPPVGWQGAGSATWTQNTDPTYIRRGTYSCLAALTATGTIRTDTAGILGGRGTTYSAKVDLYKVTSGNNVVVTLRNQAGTILATANAGTTPGWYSVELTGIGIGAATGLYLQCVPSTGSQTFYLDSAQISVGATQSAWTLGSGPSNAWRRALTYLETYAFEPTGYTLSVADLNRWSPDEWPYDAFVLGARVNITDTELGITTSARIEEITRDYLQPLRTTLVLDRSTRTLTTVLSAA